jgi:ankyrin repeat protein
MLHAGDALTLAEGQFKIARIYGFESWPRLKEHVDLLEEVGKLKHAIDTNDLGGVRTLMSRNPALHRAAMGYGNAGPLTWVAECRVPWEPPTPTRLAMAQWMIDNGSDVHQGGDAPLMRAALRDDRIPMMELLVKNGADENAEWDGHFPILFAPCECLAPLALKWLLEHGADPGLPEQRGRQTPLDYVIGTYARSAHLGRCIEILLKAGCRTSYDEPAVLELLRGRLGHLKEMVQADASLVNRRFAGLRFGNTGGRRLQLEGGTLLHVAAEYGSVKAAQMLIAHGAGVNARADLSANGTGGQTAIFHAVSQFADFGLAMTRYLVESGADLGIKVVLPGHYEREHEYVECTPLGYARLFPGTGRATVGYLESVGAPG